MRDLTGALLTLTAVEVSTPTQVRLRFAQPLPAGKTCRVSYGHPFAQALGTIGALRSGPDKTEELLLKSSFASQLKPLLAEGAFFVTSISRQTTRVAIRATSEDNGVTVLHYDPRELRNNVRFVAGQEIVAQRSFSYGNLRDSDPERSIHTFGDASYGIRAGQAYPLWNWCVLFGDLTLD